VRKGGNRDWGEGTEGGRVKQGVDGVGVRVRAVEWVGEGVGGRVDVRTGVGEERKHFYVQILTHRSC
jgi:hypothetical protein